MREFNVGEIIKEGRLRKKLTQAELADGICDLQTISRIERGTQTPRHSVLNALLERIGLAADECHRISRLEELKLEELKQQIKFANAKGNREKAIELAAGLKRNFDCSDNILNQFLLWTDAINGKLVDNIAVPYSNEEKIEKLKQAVRLTVSDFDENSIDSFCLEMEAVRIIIAIANTYSCIGNYERAINIYSQLLSYIDKNLLPISERSKIIPLLTYNYSGALDTLERNEETIRIAEIGIECCRQYQKDGMLGELLINKACALHRLGNDKDGLDAAVQSYYVLKAMNSISDSQKVKSYLKEEYDFETI